MRWVVLVLCLAVLGLQYRLWWGEGGRLELQRLQKQAENFERENTQLRERNAELARLVMDLKAGNTVLEQRAREELGLTRDDEVYYQFVDPDEQTGLFVEDANSFPELKQQPQESQETEQ